MNSGTHRRIQLAIAKKSIPYLSDFLQKTPEVEMHNIECLALFINSPGVTALGYRPPPVHQTCKLILKHLLGSPVACPRLEKDVI